MKKQLGTVRKIAWIERANSSVNGNPAWVVGFEDGAIMRTQSDASVSYEIGNPNMRGGCTVEVFTSRAGRITYMHERA